MLRIGKTAQTAIAAMSLLAECYGRDQAGIKSHEIAKRRRLPHPLVAKVLTILSTSGLVRGTRGPGGGYWLARDPSTIPLYEIVVKFERSHKGALCPFGPNWCGHGEPCPLHDSIADFTRSWEDTLRNTTLGIFVKSG